MKKVCYLVVFMLIAMLAISCSEDDGNNGNRDNPNNPNNPDDPNNPPAGNSGWTQLTNFGGSPRSEAVAFTINGKVYAGLGISVISTGLNSYYKDFWEYDPATNKWTQKASYPGYGNAVGFSIGEKGYVGFRYGDNNYYYLDEEIKEFWEYDPATNKWTQKANFHGTPPLFDFTYPFNSLSLGFSSENRAYVIQIPDGNYGYTTDSNFWEYNPATDQWTQKANCPGSVHLSGKGAYMNNKGYAIFGNECWEYDINMDQWVRKNDLPYYKNYYSNYSYGVCFVVNNKLYAGLGYDWYSAQFNNNIYEFDVDGNQWIAKTESPINAGSVAVIQNKVYIGLNGNVEFWQYIP